MRRILLVLVLQFAAALWAFGQLGGTRAFEYLNIPNNARLAALGGVNITSGWNDPTQVSSNPALLTDTLRNQMVISRLGYFADISQTSLSYVTEFEKYGTWGFHLDYLNYGDIQSFDEAGFLNGDFRVNEYTFRLSNSRAFGPFQVGASLKLAVSDLSAFKASALLLDVGGTFKHPEKELTVGFVIQNLGFLISDYTDDNNSQLPLDLQLGMSYKPEFMPFRFSVTARNLARADAVFFDPSSNALFGQTEEPGFGEEIFRRLVFGAELIASPNFQLRFGYNHLLRKELRLENASGGAGFSFGFMFKVKRFEFAYSRALYHAAGGSNTLQINMNTVGLIKKK